MPISYSNNSMRGSNVCLKYVLWYHRLWHFIYFFLYGSPAQAMVPLVTVYYVSSLEMHFIMAQAAFWNSKLYSFDKYLWRFTDLNNTHLQIFVIEKSTNHRNLTNSLCRIHVFQNLTWFSCIAIMNQSLS